MDNDINKLTPLIFGAIRYSEQMHFARVIKWQNSLIKLGINLPIFLVADFGYLFVYSVPQDKFSLIQQVWSKYDENIRQKAEIYLNIIKEISSSEVILKAKGYDLSDELISVILAKIFNDIYKKAPREVLSADFSLFQENFDKLPEYNELFNNFLKNINNFNREVNFLSYIADNQYKLLTSLEQLDLDTLKLLGLFHAGDPSEVSVDLIDLLNVMITAQANDIINFSLEILPSVLETKIAGGQQTFSVDGFSGITRNGNIDSLILSEFAYDEDIFYQRFIENEMFYFAHERQQEELKQIHYILIDASASMRGSREVFGRGLALTLAKKLTLKGDQVWIRFFDSRLYDITKSTGTNINVSYLLCFRSEHGRNYSKVFNQLLKEIPTLQRTEKKKVILYIITHAECHVPVDIIEKLNSNCYIYGIFILPSAGKVNLEYLNLLNQYQIIDENTLSNTKDRAKKALEIVDNAANI